MVDKDPDADPVEAKITVAALALTETVVGNVEAAAASLAADWIKAHAKAIALLPEADRARYARLQAQAKDPSLRPGIIVDGTIEDAVSIELAPDQTNEELFEAIRADANNRWPRHIYQDDADGLYWKKPSPSDGLERKVLHTELADSSLVAWYRNPTGGDRALCVPYRDTGTDTWSRLFPDFIVFHAVGGIIKASIIDPHGIQLRDWADKLSGYVEYAEQHGDAYRAIWPITEIDGKRLALSLHDKGVRAAVRAALESGENVEAIFRICGIEY
jgi:hypothetical protein